MVVTVRSLTTPTHKNDWYSVAVCAKGEYGTDAGLISSFPIRTIPGGGYEIVSGVNVNDFSRGKIDATLNELREERSMVAELLG